LPTNSAREPYVVSFQDVVVIHNSMVTQFGGLAGIRDRTLIEAAVGRPYTGYYPSIEEKGAALLESLACNHGFVDGNKRTALLALYLFLVRSGYILPGGESLNAEAEKMVLDLVEHRMNFDGVVAWLKLRILPLTMTGGPAA
jgi:death on curing protein